MEVVESGRFVYKKPDGATIKAMIVDDSQFMRKQIKRIFMRMEIDLCCEANDGEEAVELFEKHKPDFITMDITMPKLNGVDALKKILAIDNKAKIVMITAIGHESKVKECVMKGAVNFIVKPFRVSEASERIYNTLKKCFG